MKPGREDSAFGALTPDRLLFGAVKVGIKAHEVAGFHLGVATLHAHSEPVEFVEDGDRDLILKTP